MENITAKLATTTSTSYESFAVYFTLHCKIIVPNSDWHFVSLCLKFFWTGL